MKTLAELIKEESEANNTLLERIVELLDTSEYIKAQEKKLDNWEPDYLSGNDIGGVDARVNLCCDQLRVKELEELPKHLVKEGLELFYEDREGYYYNSNDDEISISTAEEIWINTHENTIHFPDNTDSAKFKDDFHAWLLAEEWMVEGGWYPGIYTQDYHGNVDSFKYDEELAKRFPEDEKARLSKINEYLLLFKSNKDLGHNQVLLEDCMCEDHFALLSQELKDINFEQPIEVMDITEITFDSVTIQIEIDNQLKYTDAKLVKTGTLGTWYDYEFTLQLTSNVIRFILQDEKPKGGIHEMSLLPVG
ncbi:hypothetical protein N9948_02065 [bacterium]|nr:hypothetical protein [bacterium]